ncbi:MAG: type III-B CRISPR module-associated protein Cmr3 [Canidatus Methanoxibalbensis ujae]|nr:type III-B CRISPR module-associated protein Cmr3 [Candidatus Methanoxibalbensis ujae]
MKRLFIEPLDVLMFRSERPFIARESHVAKLGVISPLTFEGAIKSKIFLEFCKRRNYLPSDFQRKKNEDRSSLNERVKKLIEDDKELKEILDAIGHPAVNSEYSIQVLGVFFSKKDEKEEYFSIPNDTVRKDEDDEILKLTPILKEELKIPDTKNYTCFSIHSKIKEEKGLMPFDALKDYLWGGKPDKSQIIDIPYKTELRTGIQLEKGTKTTVEGHLYTAEFLRLKDWKEHWEFVVWIEDKHKLLDKYLKNEVIRLGGEGKGAICTKIDKINLADKLGFSELIEKINEEKRFKLYLASPSCFNGHESPSDKLERELGVKELKMIAKLPGKPIYIGGYDFAMNREKPLRRWVNAGAVYYYEFDGEIKRDNLLIKIINKNNIDMRCAFIGRW